MKTDIFKTVVTVIVFLATCFMTGCQKEEEDYINIPAHSQGSEYKFLNKKFKTPEGMTTWEAQMREIIKNNELIQKDGLTLSGYRFIREITNPDEIEEVKSNLNNNSFLIKYDNDRSFTVAKSPNYDIVKSSKILDQLIPTSEIDMDIAVKSSTDLDQTAVYLFENNDMGIVELEWIYKGDKFNTTCIVSNKKGIIYDDLLYFIHFVYTVEFDENNNVQKTFPRLKNNSPESGTSSCGNKTSFEYIWSKGDQAYNLYGIKVWSYSIICNVKGLCSTGSKSIYTKNLEASATSAIGFSADAKIESKSFVQGVNGHLDFAWAYAYATLGSVSISWNGFGFTFSGGGTRASGEKYVNPGDLY
jgi:hypothetical protein